MHVTARTYLVTWIALVALAAATLLLSFAGLGPFATPVALGIASIKGGLVALFFMHLVEQRAASWLACLASIVLLAVLVTFSAADVGTRWTSTQPLGPWPAAERPDAVGR